VSVTGQVGHVVLIPRPGEDGSTLATRFTKACLRAGTLKEIKRRAYYVKRSLARRKKAILARQRFYKTRDASGELKSQVAFEARRFREG
jgi:ribosomal protein S21